MLAVACHELGHWKMNHVPIIAVVNMFYMLIIGLIMIPFIENPHFLASFNINMQSPYMNIWLIYIMFTNSVHCVLKWFLKFYERSRELDADRFSVECGYGKAAMSALIRNFSMNKAYLFQSEYKNKLATHPTLMRRLAHLR